VLCPVGEPIAWGLFATEAKARMHLADMPNDGCSARDKHTVIKIYIEPEMAVNDNALDT